MVKVDHVKITVGYGRRYHVGKGTTDYFKMHKNSIFNPELRTDHNSMCLAVAIVISAQL